MIGYLVDGVYVGQIMAATCDQLMADVNSTIYDCNLFNHFCYEHKYGAVICNAMANGRTYFNLLATNDEGMPKRIIMQCLGQQFTFCVNSYLYGIMLMHV